MQQARLAGEGGLIVHEWIEPSGGAEKVLDAFHELAPAAELFCLWDDAPDRYPNTRVHESWLARSPLRDRKAASMLVMSHLMRHAPLSDRQWVLASSHSFAHHVGIRGRGRQVPTFVYAHTPPRYLWAPEVDPRAASAAVRLTGPVFRALDRRAAGRGAHYAVNSAYVAERARRSWRLEPRVIHPPVDVERVVAVLASDLVEEEGAVLDGLPDAFVLGVSRFVPYKRLDLVIQVAQELDVPAVICGSGPEEGALRRLASAATVPVHVLLRPTDGVLFRLMARSLLFVFPPVEDFGIVPAEALAAGARILVNDRGGAREIVSLLGGGAVHDFAPGGAAQVLEQARSAPVPRSEDVHTLLGRPRFIAEVRDWMRDGGVDLTSSGPVDGRPVS